MRCFAEDGGCGMVGLARLWWSVVEKDKKEEEWSRHERRDDNFVIL